MEESEWKKDETPYLVFKCVKCKQYLYVKPKQKSKRCLRCGHMHKVSNILGESIYGLLHAIEMVKKRQDEVSIKELGRTPELRSLNDFKVLKKPKSKINNKFTILVDSHFNEDLIEKFKIMLIELSHIYKEFPNYILEIMGEKYNISPSELKILTRIFLKQGILIPTADEFYKIKTS
ncbi:MAG: DUF1922 domain-containing protein [Promethearchaeota archaeon]